MNMDRSFPSPFFNWLRNISQALRLLRLPTCRIRYMLWPRHLATATLIATRCSNGSEQRQTENVAKALRIVVGSLRNAWHRRSARRSNTETSFTIRPLWVSHRTGYMSTPASHYGNLAKAVFTSKLLLLKTPKSQIYTCFVPIGRMTATTIYRITSQGLFEEFHKWTNSEKEKSYQLDSVV